MTLKAVIVCASPEAWIDEQRLKNQETIFIGVDRGALTLIKYKILPNLAIGDFDSVTAEEFQCISKNSLKTMRLHPEKDETDTELAISHALSLSASKIDIYGGLGGRLDHSIANIRLLLRYSKKGISINLINETNHMVILKPGNYTFEAFKHSYLSFFAIEETVTDLTLSGVKYPLTKYTLTKYTLTQDDIRCVSNEVVLENYHVAFSKGYLLMIRSQDLK